MREKIQFHFTLEDVKGITAIHFLIKVEEDKRILLSRIILFYVRK